MTENDTPLRLLRGRVVFRRKKRPAVEEEAASFCTAVDCANKPATLPLKNDKTMPNSHSSDSLLSYSAKYCQLDDKQAVETWSSSPMEAILTLDGPYLPEVSTINMGRNESRRRENSLELWILEAKGIPPKRSYFCQLCLDKTLFGRTSSKSRGDSCFWGEHFEFNQLAEVNMLCINVFREADPRKKKDRITAIGFVEIPVEDLATRQPIERWSYTLNGAANCKRGKSKSETASIRVKARFQNLDILPLKVYDQLVSVLRIDYLQVCQALEPGLGVKAKEDFASSLVRILYKHHMARDFLCDLIMAEVNILDNEHLTFRGNSLATKAMEAYTKLVADDYLTATLRDQIRSVVETVDEDCEVDPLKLSSCTTLDANRRRLTDRVQTVWAGIVQSVDSFPTQLKSVLSNLRVRLQSAGRSDLSDKLISSSVFLRLLCPAILSPSLFRLVGEFPSGPPARTLTLIAKTLQTLANLSKFGGKEHYMEFMNDFVGREWTNMRRFLADISTMEMKSSKNAGHVDEPLVDVGKELALLHGYLDEFWLREIGETCTTGAASKLRLVIDVISTVKNDRDQMETDEKKTFIFADESILSDSLTIRRAGMSVQKNRQHQQNRTAAREILVGKISTNSLLFVVDAVSSFASSSSASASASASASSSSSSAKSTESDEDGRKLCRQRNSALSNGCCTTQIPAPLAISNPLHLLPPANEPANLLNGEKSMQKPTSDYEWEEIRRRFAETNERLKKAQVNEWNWRTRFESERPRWQEKVRQVEKELRHELQMGLRRQALIEAQKREIDTLLDTNRTLLGSLNSSSSCPLRNEMDRSFESGVSSIDDTKATKC